MVDNIKIIHTRTLDPWWNLAVEEYLLDRVNPGQCILYLWQNENTVVIGRNQNPWRECRTEQLESDGGKLARRLSGGGAVFHDTGNLNFTFIVDRKLYDLEKQLTVILNAVKELGIEAEMSGRNDLIADGRKFSGNAFCFRKDSAYHHGTVLVSADFSKLSKYLAVSAEKMRSKGVKSVQSRVVNLSELKPGLTVDEVAEALKESFQKIHGMKAETEVSLKDAKYDRQILEELYAKYSSWRWRYGEAPKFDIDLETRFPWGGVEIGFRLEGGKVVEASVFSDALDESYIAGLPDIFKGCEFSSKKLAQRIRDFADADEIANQHSVSGQDGIRRMTLDLAEWIESKSF